MSKEKRRARKEARRQKRAERKANRIPLLHRLGVKVATNTINKTFGMEKRKKPFFQTRTGGVIKGIASIVAPNIVNALEGVTSIPDAIGVINNAALPEEQKVSLREIVLREYEAEVMDRSSAREAEIARIEAGGSNHLMTVLGWGVTITFLMLVAVTLGVYELPENINKEYFMFGAGAVSSAFMTVLAYYFGSSAGSAQKNKLIR